MGDNRGRSEPMIVHGLSGKGVVGLSAGRDHSMAVLSNGELYGFGKNEVGQAGFKSKVFGHSSTPLRVNHGSLVNKHVVKVICGYYHSLALDSDGTLHSFGRNEYGQCGLGTVLSKSTGIRIPTAITFPEDGNVCTGVENAWCGAVFSVALLRSGELYGWGRNRCGQLSNGTTNDSSGPVLMVVPNSKPVIGVAAGYLHCIILCSDVPFLKKEVYDVNEVCDNTEKLGVQISNTDKLTLRTAAWSLFRLVSYCAASVCGQTESAECLTTFEETNTPERKLLSELLQWVVSQLQDCVAEILIETSKSSAESIHEVEGKTHSSSSQTISSRDGELRQSQARISYTNQVFHQLMKMRSIHPVLFCSRHSFGSASYCQFCCGAQRKVISPQNFFVQFLYSVSFSFSFFMAQSRRPLWRFEFLAGFSHTLRRLLLRIY